MEAASAQKALDAALEGRTGTVTKPKARKMRQKKTQKLAFLESVFPIFNFPHPLFVKRRLPQSIIVALQSLVTCQVFPTIDVYGPFVLPK